MEVPPLLLQTIGSLAAILALAGLAWWLKLGGAPLLDSDDVVRMVAGEVDDGFDPVAMACDPAGAAALARDARGQIMVIRRHGNRFAGRILTPAASARIDGTGLIVDPGEPRFGTVTLDLAEAKTWADAINRLHRQQDA